MKARIFGPLMMVAVGTIAMLAPSGAQVGAGEVDPCLEDTLNAAGLVDPDDCCLLPQGLGDDQLAGVQQVGRLPADCCLGEPSSLAGSQQPIDCCEIFQAGVVEPCVADTVPETTQAPTTTEVSGSGGQIPTTGSKSIAWSTLLGAALAFGGAVLLMLGRRKPAASN